VIAVKNRGAFCRNENVTCAQM